MSRNGGDTDDENRNVRRFFRQGPDAEGVKPAPCVSVSSGPKLNFHAHLDQSAQKDYGWLGNAWHETKRDIPPTTVCACERIENGRATSWERETYAKTPIE